jgi:hypothetical protein
MPLLAVRQHHHDAAVLVDFDPLDLAPRLHHRADRGGDVALLEADRTARHSASAPRLIRLIGVQASDQQIGEISNLGTFRVG